MVEDSPLAAQAIIMRLEKFDCHVELAENGAKAVEMAEKNDYDLILMDIGSPDFSGIEATLKIRALDDTVPIVALTAHAGNAEKRQEALDAGMNDIMSKPAEPLPLKDLLNEYIFKESCIIDWERCIQQFSDLDEAKKMVEILVETLRNEDLPSIEKHYKINPDNEALRAALHKMKGDTSYIPVPIIEKTREAFHDAVRDDSMDKQSIETCYIALKKAIEEFLVFIDQK